MRCPVCHLEPPAGVAFCPNCGHPVSNEAEPAAARAAESAPADQVKAAAQPAPAAPEPPDEPEAPADAAKPAAPAASEPQPATGAPVPPAANDAAADATASAAAGATAAAAATATAPEKPQAPASPAAGSETTGRPSSAPIPPTQDSAGSGGTDALAVASLVCSLVGIFVLPIILDVLGIIFGAIALRRNPKGSSNRNMALAGLIIGIIVLVIALIGLVVLGAAVMYGFSY